MRTIQNPVALALWKDGSNAFDKIGQGKCYTERGSYGGSIRLSFRAVEKDNPAEMASWMGSYDAPISDVSLMVWVDCNGAHQLEFEAAHLGHANLRKLESIVALMKKWEKKAAALYMGGTESFDTALRRGIAATGAKHALVIRNWNGSNRPCETMSISDAIGVYVMPAVGEIRSLLRDPDKKAA